MKTLVTFLSFSWYKLSIFKLELNTFIVKFMLKTNDGCFFIEKLIIHVQKSVLTEEFL